MPEVTSFEVSSLKATINFQSSLEASSLKKPVSLKQGSVE